MEANRLVNVEYARGFTDALEYIFNIFNKLDAQSTLNNSTLNNNCEGCKLIEEISKLRSFAKDREFEKIEQELGYYLP